MRSLLIILAVLAVCYILLLGIPESPGQIQFIKFFQAMRIEVRDLIDHFSLMQHPWVKVTLIAGAALLFTGFVRQLAR